MGFHSLLQGIFLTQGSNPGGSPTLQADSLPSETPGKTQVVLIKDEILGWPKSWFEFFCKLVRTNILANLIQGMSN